MTTITDTKYYVTKDMKYDTYHLERGEIFMPLGRANDAALIRVDYFRDVKEDYPHGTDEAQCVACGKTFVEQMYKAMHDNREHTEEIEVDLSEGPNAVAVGDVPVAQTGADAATISSTGKATEE